jgi:alkaline phosphatase D
MTRAADDPGVTSVVTGESAGPTIVGRATFDRRLRSGVTGDVHDTRVHASQPPPLSRRREHEVTNNWFPERLLADERHQVKSCALLAARAKQAMFEYTPLRPNAVEPERVYRAFRLGPLLDLFLLDMRSYRGPNGDNRQAVLDDRSRLLGATQTRWLKRRLLASAPCGR